MNEELLTPQQLCNRLQVPLSWIRRRCMEPDFPKIVLGKYRRFKFSDIERYIEKKSEAALQ